ncbi:MAG: protein-L-isoaspartate(D-aspartate) O-methyltransferase [Solirubrobacteraceae bacterium]|jgi:protein-L-isoaspartate(D-aspartate) O-methyltransferase|nr:protein-L-isoaspartate(D-aspartate) O-methyltransferase [Solirubrobacteraceae bacterium]
MSEADRLVAELRPYVADERVLDAIARVPREAFVPPELRASAYENTALGIGCGQTISQPLVVARMAYLLELRPGDRVLDVGTGSGYHAAVLAALASHVWSIERHPDLSREAAEALRRAGVSNVTLLVGDGSHGVPEEAPFDAINVAAAGDRAGLEALEAQLAPGGRLVAPITGRRQRLAVARSDPDRVRWREFEEVRFVPLVRDR